MVPSPSLRHQKNISFYGRKFNGRFIRDCMDDSRRQTVFVSHIAQHTPIVFPVQAAKLASKHRTKRFKVLKLKVGKNLNTDIDVLKAIRKVYPDCSFILDANEGYSANEAIEVLEKLHEMGVTPVLFE